MIRMQGTHVQSLAAELRSHMPRGRVKDFFFFLSILSMFHVELLSDDVW